MYNCAQLMAGDCVYNLWLVTTDCVYNCVQLMAGDYLLVWGEQDEDGFMEAELMDGRCV